MNRTILLVASILLIWPARGLSQDSLTTVLGRVIDAETDAPVGAASVEVLGRAGRVLADDDGRFALAGVSVRNLRLIVRRLGYAPLSIRLNLAVPEGGFADTTILQDPFPLRPLPAQLDELVVETTDPWIDRPFFGKGEYRRTRLVTRAELVKTPYQMDQVLRRAVAPGGRRCYFEFYIDDRHIPPHVVWDEVVEDYPIDYEAIEVYRAMNSTDDRPAIFGQFRRRPNIHAELDRLLDSRPPCGVIRLWTFQGSPPGSGTAIAAEAGDSLPPNRGEVRGRVLDARLDPVPGVLILLLDHDSVVVTSISTDRDGRYVLRASAGVYRIRSVRKGYDDWTSEVFGLEAGQIVDFTPAGEG